ncbi:ABC transporter ATP-binding protein [Arthrobacter sp. zg-Y820]|uniref:ABC transporter ATP-binding protein n=1 Tax=unclassified Arthrobacter TaxID=235627 RepID=UPI001E5F4FD2|nr:MULTISPECIES: ABC transporter ATP-binding protein [unclassified Arthrobacter]MCC9196940.1 ABC transporter ATP-binding protein [Arthrobacter sp. zg-Y820]MDK1279805.1 ABC transporter ATP-binding protein [Arthrobacter sp. zg.Y820]WIB10944.1 ABC transporter ATP-binding protein [Arthrobacter sp. zg-Y820]
MTAAGAVLEISDLSVGYGGTPVCGPITARAEAGEILGMVGFNGAGKSTAARTIAGKQAMLGGEVRVHGLPVYEDGIPFRRQVAALFDEDAFFPSLSVREHLQLVARGHSLPDPDAAVDAELEYFALGERADAVPAAVSSGQRRRLLLASALIRPSSLLILDEPEQRLDPAMRERLGTRIKTYADDGGTVLLVTHDPALLLATAGRCLLIDDDVREIAPEQAAAEIAGR